MNNYSNSNFNIPQRESGNSYTPPSVPKTSPVCTTIFAAIFFVGSIFLPFPVSILLSAIGAILTAKGFSASSTFLPILAPIPAVLICIFTNSYLELLIPIGGTLCAVAMFLTLKCKGNKTSAVIASTCVILSICLILFVCFMYSSYSGISADDFKELMDDLREAFAFFTEEYLKIIDETFEQIPDELPQKKLTQANVELWHELLDDPDPLFESFISILPGIFVLISNIFSYFMALIYFYLVRENTGHKVFATSESSKLTIAVPGVILFAAGYFFLALSFFLPMPAVIGLNFVIIYTPALCIIGARSLLDPELRRRNRILLFAAIAMLFFNPVLSFLLLGFMGANSIITQAMLNFIKKQSDRNNMD